ncbi:hypothetical protein ACVBEH_30335, partial [Roseateles sp. GG27B]
VQVYEPKGDESPVPPDDLPDVSDVAGAADGENGFGGGADLPPEEGDGIGGAGGAGRIKYVVGNVAVFVAAERVMYYGADGKL